MITISSEQYQALEALALVSFESRVLAHLQRCFPEQVGRLGEEAARAAIRAGTARVHAYGIASERQVCIFIDLMFALGERFHRDPRYPWVRTILLGLDSKAPATRIDRLYDRALAAQGAPGSLAAARSDADKSFGDDPAGTASHGGGASNPCSGLGSMTDVGVKACVESFKAVQKDWPRLTPDQRRDKLEALGNSAIGKCGVPTAGIKSESMHGPGDAHFSFCNWELVVDDATLKSPSLSDADAKELAHALLRECRHAEQWYLMARRHAGEGASAEAIREELGIPGSVARAAVANPLKPDDPCKVCADGLYESVYGKDAAARNKTLGELAIKAAALAAAAGKLDAATRDPAADKAKAGQDYRQAYDEYLNMDEARQALPEETDAWECARKVQQAW